MYDAIILLEIGVERQQMLYMVYTGNDSLY